MLLVAGCALTPTFTDKRPSCLSLIRAFEAERWQLIGFCQHQQLSLHVLYAMPIARLWLLVAEFWVVQEHEPTALDYVTFIASEKVIVCTRCSTAVPVTGLDTHLRTCHHVPFKLRRATIARFDGVPAAQSFNDLVPRQDESTPLSYLPPPAPGFCCPHCTKGKTISWDRMRQHAKAEHNISAPECVQDQSRYECYLRRARARREYRVASRL
jgi:hypothetical protein